jgi:serine protease Do
VALIGFPLGGLLGFSHVTHRGIVSSITPIVLPPAHASQLEAAAVARMRQGVFDILQLDATAYPGNSGGPLLDVESGEVVGIVNMVVVKTTRESALSTPSGISYAIPVKWLHALLARR